MILEAFSKLNDPMNQGWSVPEARAEEDTQGLSELWGFPRTDIQDSPETEGGDLEKSQSLTTIHRLDNGRAGS